MYKTIKELAELHGMSKQGMRKHINKLPAHTVGVGGNNTILVSREGQEILEKMLSTATTNRQPGVATNHQPAVDTEQVRELQHKLEVAELEKRLAIERAGAMETQLENQQKQIDTLLQIVDQAQKLQALAEQKLQLLESKDEPKKRWWRRKTD